MSENRVLFVNLAVIAGCLLSSSLARAASPDDLLADAKYIWFFDTDVNGNGVLDVDDVRDVRDWGSTVPGSYAGLGKPASVTGTGEGALTGDIAWESGNVVSPEQGIVQDARSLNLVSVTNGAGKCVIPGFKMGSGSAWCGSMTAIARIKVDSFNGWPMLPSKNWTRTRCWLINNGMNDSATSSGLAFGVGPNNYDPANGFLRVLGRGVEYEVSSIKLSPNVWYDVAWSIKDNGDGTAKGVFIVVKDGIVQTADADFENVFSDRTTASVFSVGSRNIGSSLSPNDAQRFSGNLSRLAVWDKALTQDELLSVMTQPRPWFELGVGNGSGEEFGLDAEADYTYEIEKEPFHAMPRSLSAEHPALTLIAPIHTKMDEHKVPYVFEVKAASDSGSAEIELTIQGKKIGDSQTVSAGGSATWYVSANAISIADDAVPSIVLTRKSGGATAFVFDKISMTGSYALGVNDWTNAELSGGGGSVYIGMRDVAKINDAPGDKNGTLTYRFFVPADFANSHSYVLASRVMNFGSDNAAKTKIVGAGFTNAKYPFVIALNGEQIYQAENGLANGTQFSAKIPRGKMVPGWNEISVAPPQFLLDQIEGVANWWMGFDYYTLSISKEHKGVLLIVR